MSSADREYDPEIKDIADYVANKTIDSELAVSAVNSAEADFAPRKIPRLEASHLNTNKLSRKLNGTQSLKFVANSYLNSSTLLDGSFSTLSAAVLRV